MLRLLGEPPRKSVALSRSLCGVWETAAPLSNPSIRRKHVKIKSQTRPLNVIEASVYRSLRGKLGKEGDWTCPNCCTFNHAAALKCSQCGQDGTSVEIKKFRIPFVKQVLEVEQIVYLGSAALLLRTGDKLDDSALQFSHISISIPQDEQSSDTFVQEQGCSQVLHDFSKSTENACPVVYSGSRISLERSIGQKEVFLAKTTDHRLLMTGDWVCPRCRVLNFAFRTICFKCMLSVHDPSVLRFIVPYGKVPRFDPCNESESYFKIISYIFASSAKRAGYWVGNHINGRSEVGPLWACRNCFFVNRMVQHACRKCEYPKTWKNS